MKIVLKGQVRGGKNNMIVTRTGLRFPKKSWAIWRDAAVAEVRKQLPPEWKPIEKETLIEFAYVAGDRRRRDMPAIIDAVFHVLEKAGFVADDTLLWVGVSSRVYSKELPGVMIEIIAQPPPPTKGPTCAAPANEKETP